jgi:hypothetical protein
MSVVPLTITRREFTKGLAFADTPEGEVVIHIRDGRIPVFMEGRKTPFIGDHRLFLHSDRHLPRVGETVVGLVRPSLNSRRAFWCPMSVWDAACRRYEVIRVDNNSGESTVWQGDGILMLSLYFHSETYKNGIISQDSHGFYRLVDITDEDEIVPNEDPRLSHYRLPRDLIEDFPAWI